MGLGYAISEEFILSQGQLITDTLAKVGIPTINYSPSIEVMLVEQLALAHFNIGRLQMKASQASDAKLAIAYGDAATRLLAEFRRCTLALEDFRAKQVSRKAGSAQPEAEAKPSARNGRSHGSCDALKKPATTKKGTNGNGEVPQWLKERMHQCPIPNGSKQAAATG